MGFVSNDVVVRELDATYWAVVEPITYQGRTETFIVPKDFKTDFASVPRPLVWLLPRYGLYTKSAILHDFLCRHPDVSRADADGLFRRSMRELGVPFLRRWMMWAAVRLGSRLRGAGLSQVGIWLLVALPSLAFVIAPATLVLLWVGMFALLEWLLYLTAKPMRRRSVRPPEPAVNTT
jgi:Protein of unknown function (DUF1353)